MDTMTYASVAVLPRNIALSKRQLAVPEAAFAPLDLSYITSKHPDRDIKAERRSAKALAGD